MRQAVNGASDVHLLAEEHGADVGAAEGEAHVARRGLGDGVDRQATCLISSLWGVERRLAEREGTSGVDLGV